MKHPLRLTIFVLVAIALAVCPAVSEAKKAKKAKSAAQESQAKDTEQKDEAKPAKPDDGTKPSDEEKAKDAKDAAAKPPEGAEQPAKDKEGEKKEEPKEKKADDAKKPSTHKVEKGPFKVEVSLEGVFEAKHQEEVVLYPEQWSTFKVLKAVEHGQRVKKGELLVTLDMEKIDREIADRRAALKLADLDVRLAEQEVALLEDLTPLDLELAARSQKYAAEDLKRYFDVEAPMQKKAADFTLKGAKDYLEYQQEEVRQLEKMYKADDLTEETEEIVLKRARNNLEEAKFAVEMSDVRHDETVKVRLPRQEQDIKEAARRLELKWDKAKKTLPVALKKAQLTLEKTKVEKEKTEQKLDELLADREAMVIKSPIDGVVYYGKFTRGAFGGASLMSESLQPRGTLTANSVLMTVVQTRPMFVRASVPEKQLFDVRAGQKGVVKPTCDPEMNLAGIVEEVDSIPFTAGSFGVRLTVALDGQGKELTPGMKCDVQLIPYLKKDALTVPPKAVRTDELDPQKQYVNVLAKDGKTKKQPVTVGRKTSEKVEILKGLAVGDEVLLEDPEKK